MPTAGRRGGRGGAGSPRPPATIAAALARWRGPAYPELADDDDGRAEATRLEELRILRDGAARRGAPDRRARRTVSWSTWRPWSMSTRCASARARCSWRRWPPRDGPPTPCGCSTTSAALLGDELGIEPSAGLTAQHAALLAGPSVAAWTPPHRLPVAATSLLGRDDLVGEAISLVGDHRVVTLSGRAGSARSRLADRGRPPPARRAAGPTRRAHRAGDRHDRLGRRSGRGRARPSTVGRAWGSTIASPAVLGDLEVVLLLDNCEHVLEPMAALVEAVVAGCPNVTMVTTSRERLRVNGERALPRAPAGARRRRTTRPSSCSWSERRRSRRGSPRGRRIWPASPRSCVASTGCPSPSSWPPPGCTRWTWRRSPPGSTAGSGSSPPARGHRAGTDRWARRWPGPSVCSATSCGARSPSSRSLRARSRPLTPSPSRRRARTHPRPSPSWRSARWSCGCPGVGTCCWRPCGPTAPTCSPRTGRRTTSVGGTPSTSSSRSKPPIAP